MEHSRASISPRRRRLPGNQHLVAAIALAKIQGSVGPADGRLQAGIVGVDLGNADGNADSQFRNTDIPLRVQAPNVLAKALRDWVGILGTGARQGGDEFLAAKTTDQIP